MGDSSKLSVLDLVKQFEVIPGSPPRDNSPSKSMKINRKINQLPLIKSLTQQFEDLTKGKKVDSILPASPKIKGSVRMK